MHESAHRSYRSGHIRHGHPQPQPQPSRIWHFAFTACRVFYYLLLLCQPFRHPAYVLLYDWLLFVYFFVFNSSHVHSSSSSPIFFSFSLFVLCCCLVIVPFEPAMANVSAFSVRFNQFRIFLRNGLGFGYTVNLAHVHPVDGTRRAANTYCTYIQWLNVNDIATLIIIIRKNGRALLHR